MVRGLSFSLSPGSQHDISWNGRSSLVLKHVGGIDDDGLLASQDEVTAVQTYMLPCLACLVIRAPT